MTVETYIYALVRFLPEPVRGEFVNVAVIAGNDSRDDWAFRISKASSRAKALDEHGALPTAMATVRMWEAGVYSRPGRNTIPMSNTERAFPSTKWLTEAAAHPRGIVQLSAPMRVRARSAEEAIDLVFPLMIAERKKREEKADVTAAQRAMKEAYRAHLIGGARLLQRGTLRTPRTKRSVDFAVANGRVVQVTQTLALNLRSEQAALDRVRSWAFLVEQVKHDGGTLTSAKRTVEVPPDIDVAMVLVPNSVDGSDVDNEAWDVLRSVDANVHTVDEADAVASRAAQRLAASY